MIEEAEIDLAQCHDERGGDRENAGEGHRSHQGGVDAGLQERIRCADDVNQEQQRADAGDQHGNAIAAMKNLIGRSFPFRAAPPSCR